MDQIVNGLKSICDKLSLPSFNNVLKLRSTEYVVEMYYHYTTGTKKWWVSWGIVSLRLVVNNG